MIRFTRTKLFFTGIALLLLGYIGYKCVLIALSDQTVGMVMDYAAESTQVSGRKRIDRVDAVIVYDVNGRSYRLLAEENVQLRVGNEVPVLYKASDPARARVYTFWNFWFRPILILPIIVWGAVVVGIGKNGSFWSWSIRDMRVSRIEIQKRRDRD